MISSDRILLCSWQATSPQVAINPQELPALGNLTPSLPSQGRHIASEYKVQCTITADISETALCVHGWTQGYRECKCVTVGMRLPLMWKLMNTVCHVTN